MMTMLITIDYMLGVLLFVSLFINVVALGAFWVTPGLRTTANRFVINLLIVNCVGCIALAPSFFLLHQNVDQPDNLITINNISGQLASLSPNNNDTLNLNKSTVIVSERIDYDCSDGNFGSINTKCKKFNSTVVVNVEESFNGDDDESTEEENILVIANDGIEIESRQPYFLQENGSRYWGVDLAIALGALSVLLVVGDTWCAVTDPLRYHIRISGLKAWCLIATMWCLGIIFGIASAFRSDNIRWITKNLFSKSSSPSNDIYYNITFSCIYFVVIILVPICLVCGMYRKIFSEAKQNGLRMRQNGSSPLLQSALNLAAASTAAQQHQVQQQHHQHQPLLAQHLSPNNGGLTMKIDKQNIPISNNESTVPLLTPNITRRYLDIPRNGAAIIGKSHHNILLTLSTVNEHQEPIKREFSTRHLLLLDQTNLAADQKSNAILNHKAPPMRQVRSTPNLNHHNRHPSTRSININESPNLIQHPSNHQQNGLTLPSVFVPPKALSYMTSIRHRLSNASSIFKYREESRAARISILVVIIFLISYFPYGILVILEGCFNIRPLVNTSRLAVLFAWIANISSPFIFAYRNKRVRRGVYRIFGMDTKSSERRQQRQSPPPGNNYNNNNNNNIKNNKHGNLFTTTIHKFMNQNQTSNCKIQTTSASCETLNRGLSKTTSYANNLGKHYLSPHGNSGLIFSTEEKIYPPVDHIIEMDTKSGTHSSSGKVLKEKISILKKVCNSSKKWGVCPNNSCTNSDTSSNTSEPIDV